MVAKKKMAVAESMILLKKPDIITELVNARKKGLPIKYCAFTVGVSNNTLRNWIDRGENDILAGKNTPYAKLAYEIRLAYAEFVGKNINNIQQNADDGNWQASAWLLERMAPEEFSQSSRAVKEEKDDSSTMTWDTQALNPSAVPTVIDADFEKTNTDTDTGETEDEN